MAKKKDDTGNGLINFEAPGQADASSKKKSRQSVFSPPSSKNSYDDLISFDSASSANPYAKDQKTRHAMDSRTRVIIILAIVVVVVAFLCATLPTKMLDPTQPSRTAAELLMTFQSACLGLLYFFTGGESLYTNYVWTVVVCGLAGAALALSGGVYQGAMKNALASPSTLGVMQGGSLGIIIYGVFIYNGDYIGTVSGYQDYLSQLSAFDLFLENFGAFFSTLLGCVLVVGIIMAISFIAGRGHVTNVSLIIAGQVFAAVAGVIIESIKYYLATYTDDPNLYQLLTTAQSATFTGMYNLTSVALFAVPLLVCFVIIYATSSKLSLLAFNDDEARSMGISTRFTRNLMVTVCTVMTALVVAFCGPVGFVGFIAPHIARHLTGPDFRFLLPVSALLGAIIVMAVNYLTLVGFPGVAEGSTGVFTSIVGCAMFLVMALRQRRGSNADWY